MTITPPAVASATPAATLTIATDGSSLGNPGPSAAAAIAEFPGGHTVRWSEPFGHARNGQMEIEALRMGMLIALASEVPRVLLVTDARYAETTWNKRLAGWEDGEPRGSAIKLKHPVILKALRMLQIALEQKGRSVTIKWTKAHQKGDNINNRVDRLANDTAETQSPTYENLEVFSALQPDGTIAGPIATLDRKQFDAQAHLVQHGLAALRSSGLRHPLPTDIGELLQTPPASG